MCIRCFNPLLCIIIYGCVIEMQATPFPSCTQRCNTVYLVLSTLMLWGFVLGRTGGSVSLLSASDAGYVIFWVVLFSVNVVLCVSLPLNYECAFLICSASGILQILIMFFEFGTFWIGVDLCCLFLLHIDLTGKIW